MDQPQNEKDLEFSQGLSLGGDGSIYQKEVRIYLERYEVASRLALQEGLTLATISSFELCTTLTSA